MQKYFFLIFIICIALVFSPIIGHAKKSSIQEQLKVVMDDNYPPFIFRGSTGELKGILIEQWDLFSKKTGIKVEISAMDWAEAQEQMAAGKFDVIDTMFKNPYREKIYDFSKPYARIDVPFFFSKEITGINSSFDVIGFIIGAKKGDNSIEILKSQGVKDFLLFDNYEAVIAAARDGKVKVFTVDEPPAHYYLIKMGIQDNFRESAPIYSGEFHRAVRKGDKTTMTTIQKGFDLITKKEYERINQHWYGVTLGKKINFTLIALIALIFVGIGSILLLWIWMLKRLVNQRTSTLEKEITVRIQAEEKLRDINETLERRVHERTLDLEEVIQEAEAFNYTIAHDLNAPLRALNGFANILKEDYAEKLDGTAKQYLNNIERNATRMATLVDDLLAFSRLSRQPIVKQKINMTSIIKETAKEIINEDDTRQIELEIQEMPDCMADPALIKQIWINLISNAYKFTAKNNSGHIIIGYESVENNNIYFIKDNGIGFDMKFHDRIFGVFQRLVGNDQFPGTGAGLAIVKRIIERHGGHIWAESKIDGGTTFFFTLG